MNKSSKILRNAGIGFQRAYKPKIGYTKTPYEKGKNAFKVNQNELCKGLALNPFKPNTFDSEEWDKGYNDAYFNQLTPKQLKVIQL